MMNSRNRVLARLSEAVVRAWYRPKLSPFLVPLLPFSALVAYEARRRLRVFHNQTPDHYPVPVIVVGNITVGGTGKTPLVAELVEQLKGQGYRPGIISRGYGSAVDSTQLVTAQSDPLRCGDEPVMLAGLTGVPVVVAAIRTRAVEFLLANTDCNLIISDDGLQHFRLARQIEIVVVDGQRMFGNGRCLPAGPLREPIERLASVDFIVCNGTPSQPLPEAKKSAGAKGREAVVMTLAPAPLRPVGDAQPEKPQASAPPEPGDTVYGVAGIGHPERFFRSLRVQGFIVTEQAFPDHHAFSAKDLSFPDQRAVIMTAKDAVKCSAFAASHWWYLPVRANIPDTFWSALFAHLQKCSPLGV